MAFKLNSSSVDFTAQRAHASFFDQGRNVNLSVGNMPFEEHGARTEAETKQYIESEARRFLAEAAGERAQHSMHHLLREACAQIDDNDSRSASLKSQMQTWLNSNPER